MDRIGNIEEWLSRPDKTVTRAELWQFLNTYHHQRKLGARLRRLGRRIWAYLTEPIVKNEREEIEKFLASHKESP